MKTNREIVENQIKLQEEIQSAGFNVVECCNCGTILLHKVGDRFIECFCQHEVFLSDCEDLYYENLQNNAEFN
jgi:hypothetical protein